MTTDDIRQALRDAVEPISLSVKELSGTFGKFQIETAVHLTEIRKDLKHVCNGHADLVSDVKELRENWPLVESHMKREDDTSAFKLQQATTKKSDPGFSIRFPKGSSFAKLAPLLLAAALGLVGIGFYLASGSSTDATATVRALRALSDTTVKMSGELKKLQDEIDAGEGKP